MSVVHRLIAIGALVVSAAAFAACEYNLNMDHVESIIKSGLAEQVGLAFSSVSCPETRAIKSADVFECKAVAEVGAGELTVEVTQKDDSGTIAWKLVNPEKVMSLTALEDQVKAAIARQMKVDAVVDCGGKRRVSAKGQTFECKATAGKDVGTVVVTVDDDKGNVSWALK